MKKSVVLLVVIVLALYVSAEDDIEKPNVQILAPTEGQSLSGEFVVRATATDNVAIERVEFLVDGVPMFTDTIPTAEGAYQWLWDTTNVADGSHQLVVAPYDGAGNFNDLSRVNVMVSNGGQTAQPPYEQPVY